MRWTINLNNAEVELKYCRLERMLVQAVVIRKVTPDHAMEGCKRSRGIAPLILNFDNRWK